MSLEPESELTAFVEQWQDTPERNKETFVRFKEFLQDKEGTRLEFIQRPGLTYSMRAVHAGPKTRALFALVDVIEDDPRWLSVCFYGEMITDVEEIGDFVPEGLLGEDAICFDLEEADDERVTYIEARLDEAYRNVSKD